MIGSQVIRKVSANLVHAQMTLEPWLLHVTEPISPSKKIPRPEVQNKVLNTRSYCDAYFTRSLLHTVARRKRLLNSSTDEQSAIACKSGTSWQALESLSSVAYPSTAAGDYRMEEIIADSHNASFEHANGLIGSCGSFHVRRYVR